ncbi:MAG: hypothetical protein ACE5E4_01645 [Candidatus Binatia bacterium]
MINRIGLLYLFVLCHIGIVLGLFEDHLFFTNSTFIITQFFSVTAFVVSAPLLAALSLAHFSTNENVGARIERVLLVGVYGILVFGFVAFLLDGLHQIEDLGLFAAAVGVGYVSCMALAWWTLDSVASPASLRVLGRTVLVAGAAVAAFTLVRYGWTRLGVEGGAARPKNVILIVLDSLSPHELAPFSDSPGAPDIGDIAERSLLFTRAYSNKVWTDGYFRVLFSGNKQGQERGVGLLGALESAGVKTRWITYHNNGIPRTAGARTAGLKSSFISEKYTWIPRLLGLDYNVFLYMRYNFRGKPMGKRESWLAHGLNKIAPRRHLFPDVVVDEVEDLRRSGQPFFLSVHSNISAMEHAPRGLWEDEPGAKWLDRLRSAQSRIRAAQYVYKPGDADVVAEWQERRLNDVSVGVERLKIFYREYWARGWDRDTLVVVTADHGHILDKGHAWYGYHADEEVTRVPLVISGLGYGGVDEHLRETVDISQTLLDFFGVNRRLSPSAVSLFQVPRPQRSVTSLTLHSNLRRQRLLAVYRARLKYVANLVGDREVRSYEVVGFDSRPVGQGEVPGAINNELRRSLAEYGLAHLYAGAGGER